MEDVRFVDTLLQMDFEELGERDDDFKREYNLLSEIEEDSVGQWLRKSKATGEAKDSDQVLLTLIVELHRKIDDLSAYIKQETKDLLKLQNSISIDKIGFHHIHILQKVLQKDKNYYARVEMPIFPTRKVPLFLRAISEDLVEVVMIHDKDQKDWNSYMTAKERVKIRESKGKK